MGRSDMATIYSFYYILLLEYGVKSEILYMKTNDIYVRGSYFR